MTVLVSDDIAKFEGIVRGVVIECVIRINDHVPNGGIEIEGQRV